MNFETMLSTLSPRLRQIAYKYRNFCPYSDAEDLYGEMVSCLWEKWNCRELDDKTESYVVQACYFHLRNYLRKVREDCRTVNMDEPEDEFDADGDRRLALSEMIPDDALPLPEFVEGNALYETVMSNGLSRVEKDIIEYLYEGFTVREIGKVLNISHAMVIRHKKSIVEKITRKYEALLV